MRAGVSQYGRMNKPSKSDAVWLHVQVKVASASQIQFHAQVILCVAFDEYLSFPNLIILYHHAIEPAVEALSRTRTSVCLGPV